MTDRLTRARRDLQAAQHLAGGGFYDQAVSRAYYAAFHAAQAALEALGESRTKHSGVVSAFGALLVRERGVDPRAGRLLHLLFEERNQADYGNREADHGEAKSAIEDAEVVIAAVERWLADRGGPDG